MIANFIDIYNLLSKASVRIFDRKKIIDLRSDFLNKKEIIKVAFDTRRINQENDFNPRRNLQFYHRFEPFIDKDSSEQIKLFFKVKTAVDDIKEQFLGSPEWLDSYCRILSAAIDRTLRIDQKDFDYFKPQMNYLQELLYLRYRLTPSDIQKMNEKEIRDLILSKDEKLSLLTIYGKYDNKQSQSNIKIIDDDDDDDDDDEYISHHYGYPMMMSVPMPMMMPMVQASYPYKKKKKKKNKRFKKGY